jgi:hypothetical protein
MFKAIALSILLGANLAQARLGETLADCETRYGPVVEKVPARLADSDKEAVVFSKEGVTIIAELHNGNVWCITYTMADLSADKATIFLEVNAPKEGWGKPINVKGEEIRTSTARDRFASYLPAELKTKQDGKVTVCSRPFTKANRVDYDARLLSIREKLQKREAGGTLKGF